MAGWGDKEQRNRRVKKERHTKGRRTREKKGDDHFGSQVVSPCFPCLVAAQVGPQFGFFPSRFVGYSPLNGPFLFLWIRTNNGLNFQRRCPSQSTLLVNCCSPRSEKHQWQRRHNDKKPTQPSLLPRSGDLPLARTCEGEPAATDALTGWESAHRKRQIGTRKSDLRLTNSPAKLGQPMLGQPMLARAEPSLAIA